MNSASSFSNSTGTVAVYSSLEYSISADPAFFRSPSSSLALSHAVMAFSVKASPDSIYAAISSSVSGMIVLVNPSAVVSIVVFVCSSISPSARTSDAPENVIDAAHTIAVKTEEAFLNI